MEDKTRQIALPGTLLVRDAGVYLLWRIPGLAVDVGQKAVLGIRPERIDRVPLEQPADRPTMGHATPP